VLEKAVAMLKSLMAKITACVAAKPVGADDIDLDKLRSGHWAKGR